MLEFTMRLFVCFSRKQIILYVYPFSKYSFEWSTMFIFNQKHMYKVSTKLSESSFFHILSPFSRDIINSQNVNCVNSRDGTAITVSDDIDFFFSLN